MMFIKAIFKNLFIISFIAINSAYGTPVTSGLRLWLDADDTTTLFQDNACSAGQEVSTTGDDVRCWQDKSGNNNHALQSAGTPRWVEDGSFNVVEFTSDRLNIPGPNAVFNNGENVSETEIFFVARTRTISNGFAFGHLNAGRRYSTHFPWGDNNVYFDVGVCCATSRISAPWGGSSDFLHTWNFINDDGAPNYQAIYRDNTLVAEDAVADFINWGTADFQLGAVGTSYQQINAAEVLIFDRRLSDAERAQVQSYLENKWREPVLAADDWTEGLTKNITAPSGTDRALVVVAGFEDNVDNSITNLTYGGQALTLLDQSVAAGSFYAGVSIWYLDDAGINAATGTNFNVTYANGNAIHTDVSSAVYTNISQTNPLFSSIALDDGQGSLTTLSAEIPVAQDGLTVVAAQSGNTGTFTTNLTTVISQSGNSTSQGVGVAVEAQDNATRTVTASKTDQALRMAMVAVNLRGNTLPEVESLSSLTLSDTSIRLNWDQSASVPNYRIAYQQGAVAPSSCTSGTIIDAGSVASHIVGGLSAGTEYSFRVCSNDGASFTNGVVTTNTTNTSPPLAPNELLGVSVDVQSPSQVNFSWVSGGGGTIGFRIAYNETGTSPVDCLSDTTIDVGNTLTHTIGGLNPLTNYSYRICAYNGTPIFSSGLTGSFATPGVGSTTNVVNINSPWESGTFRSSLGVAQNRALVYIISYENGSALASASFGGQNATFLERHNFSGASVEFWVLSETQLQSSNPSSIVLTHTGAVPERRTIASVVLENVDQTSFVSETGTNGVNNTSINTTLNTENGGLSIIGTMSRRANSIGSTPTAGWLTGSTQAIVGMSSFSATRTYTSALSDTMTVNYTGGASQLASLGQHFMLANPTSPLLLSIPSKSDNTLNLSWTSGGGSTSGFRLAYQTGLIAPADCNSGTSVDVGDTTSHALVGLTPDTDYSIRVCAYNVQGDQEAGIIISDITDALPAAPANEISALNANVISDSQIALNWFSGGGSTAGFIVAYQAGPTAPADCDSGITNDIGDTSAFLVTSLAENTLYSFRVCAYNADNLDTAGLTISATTDTGGATSTATVAGSWETGLTRSSVEAGSNRILVLAISSEDNIDVDVTAVSFGGRSLTQAVEAQSSAGTALFNRTEIWYLREADIQAASSTTFDVTWSGGNQERRYYANAVFTDIDQANPINDTTASAFALGVDPITATLNVNVGGASIVAATTHQNGTYTVGAGWSFGSNQQGNSSTLGVGFDIATANEVDSISLTHTNAGVSALSAVHFSPVEAAPNEISNLTSSPINQSTIELNWSAAGGTAIGHRVAYLQGGTAPANCNSGTQQDVGPLVNFQVPGLSPLTNYSFRVCSYNSSGVFSPGLTITEQTTSTATNWTGSNGTNWHDPLNWSNGVPDSTQDCTITNQVNDPVINTNAECRSITLQAPLTINSSSLAIFSNTLINGAASITESSGIFSIRDISNAAQTLSSTVAIPHLDIAKTSGGILNINTDLSTNELTYGAGASAEIRVGSLNALEVSSNVDIPANITIELRQGSSLNIPSGGTLTVNGGTLRTVGDIDTSLLENPGYTTTQAHIGSISDSGPISINATSGNLDLVGVHLNRLNTNGLNISGSASLTNLNGVHFVNTIASGSGAAIQLNTTGSVPSSTNYVGFDFVGTTYEDNPSYSLASSASTCGSGSHTVAFINWYGNFSESGIKINDTEPVCDIIIDTSASPVALAGVTVQGYNDAIVLEWQTTAEITHAGFNLYRSENIDSGYVQINESLILNSITSLSYAGEYRFIDNGVDNDKTYYYILEDVALIGTRTQHGPYLGLTDPLLGPVPNFLDSLNQQDSDIETNETEVVADNFIQVTDGIKAFYLPSGRVRVQINPAAPVFETSEFNSTYSSISQPGFVSLSETNNPKLSFSEILIPIETNATSIVAEEVVSDDNIVSSILIEPVPDYQLVGGTPTPVYAPDGVTYGTNKFFPQESYFEVTENSVEIDGKNFIKLLIYPVLHNPVSQELKVLEEIYIDIDFQEASAEEHTASSELILPIIEENSIRLSYTKEGYYKLSYDELFQAGVEDFISGASYEDIEVTFKGRSLPVKIFRNHEDAFGVDDSIVFFAPFEKSLYDNFNHIDLRVTRDRDAERFEELNSYLAGPIFEKPQSIKKVKYEVNNSFVDNRPLGAGVDHFFWQRIFVESGDSSSPATAKKCFDISLSNFGGNEIDFELRAAAFNRLILTNKTPVHVYLSSNPGVIEEVDLEGQELFAVKGSLEVAHSVNSSEELCIEAPAFSGITSDFRILDVDSIEVTYVTEAFHSEQSFNGLEALTNYVVPYDTNRGEFTLFQRPTVESPGVIYNNLELNSFEGEFEFSTFGFLDRSLYFDIVYEDDYEKFENISFFKVEGDLIDEMKNNELLIITQKDFLDEARTLESHKEELGTETLVITEKFLHDHFSFGEKTPESLRLALNKVKELSGSKLKYVLILNNATLDPRNFEGFGNDQRSSVYLQTSKFFDYASDLYFVQKDDGSLLDLSLGRIPVNNSRELRDVVSKIITFETTTTETIASRVSFISADDAVSDFAKMSQNLADNITTIDKSFIHLTKFTDTAANKLSVQNEFSSSLFVNYLGHGSGYELGSAHLEISDIESALSNNNPPIFVGLNCLTNYYGSSDPEDYGLGEAMILAPTGGAIASVSSNLILSPLDQGNFAHFFYQELNRVTSQGETQTKLGDLYKNAHMRLEQNNLRNNQTDSFMIIGDPSLRLPQGIFEARPSTSAKASSGGGCSAAAGSEPVHYKWYLGFIEWFFFFGLLFAARYVIRFFRREESN